MAKDKNDKLTYPGVIYENRAHGHKREIRMIFALLLHDRNLSWEYASAQRKSKTHQMFLTYGMLFGLSLRY